jgi:hypothetical protein
MSVDVSVGGGDWTVGVGVGVALPVDVDGDGEGVVEGGVTKGFADVVGDGLGLRRPTT